MTPSLRATLAVLCLICLTGTFSMALAASPALDTSTALYVAAAQPKKTPPQKKKAAVKKKENNAPKATATNKKASNPTKKAPPQSTKSSIKKAVKTEKSKKSTKAQKPKAPQLGYKSAVLFNVNAGKIVFSKNPHRQVPPASLTKILSMYVALETMKAKKIKPGTIVIVSEKAARAGGSRMGLKKGDKVRLDDLLRGMAISSGNDASIAVAEYIGGSEAAFVRMMNKKAKSLGMKRSVFKNSHGLPAKGQLTTAHDMLLLARSYLKTHPHTLAMYHNHKFFSFRDRRQTISANPLLGQFAGADGLKTGFVSAAGYNFIATAKRGKTRTIGVILGAPSSAVRASESRALMEAGFGRLAVQPGKLLTGAGDSKPTPQKKASATDKKKQTAQKASTKQPAKKAPTKQTAPAPRVASKKNAVPPATQKTAQGKKDKKADTGASNSKPAQQKKASATDKKKQTAQKAPTKQPAKKAPTKQTDSATQVASKKNAVPPVTQKTAQGKKAGTVKPTKKQDKVSTPKKTAAAPTTKKVSDTQKQQKLSAKSAPKKPEKAIKPGVKNTKSQATAPTKAPKKEAATKAAPTKKPVAPKPTPPQKDKKATTKKKP